MRVSVNRGKDLSQESVELITHSQPLSYAAFSAVEYQIYQLGMRNDITWSQVCAKPKPWFLVCVTHVINYPFAPISLY